MPNWCRARVRTRLSKERDRRTDQDDKSPETGIDNVRCGHLELCGGHGETLWHWVEGGRRTGWKANIVQVVKERENGGGVVSVAGMKEGR